MPVPAFGAIAEQVRRSAIQVLSTDEGSAGSGIIVGRDRALTNAHVARHRTATVRSWSGEILQATVERRDDGRDLALLRVPGLAAKPAVLRDSSAVNAGEMVIAIGSPMRLIDALSTGVIRGSGPVPGGAAERASLLPGDILLDPEGLSQKLESDSGTVTIRFLRGSYERERQTVVTVVSPLEHAA